MSPQVALAMVFVFGGSDVPPKAEPPAKVQTLCGCALTKECTCWETECNCKTCGRGGAAKEAKKPNGSTGASTPGTLVPSAVMPFPGTAEPSPSKAIGVAGDTSTNVRRAGTIRVLPYAGGIENCQT